ncbi:VWA domain-containing protein [Neobacillus niacini]|uniref:vWA domain-containing protein n=1 Tax=Neobacillus niacini TaxID=86668 RepID=UPI0030003C65
MPVRKFSFLFFIFSILAGIIGAVVGEWLLSSYYGVWPNILLVGVYFGQLALIAGLFCLLAEIISPVINGKSWRLEYSGQSWKVLVPATLVMLFVAGLVFQFLYSINFSKIKPPDDLVMVVDISDSMNESDPKKESLKAAKELISTMKATHRAAIISFNDEAFITKEMFPIGDSKEKTDAIEKIDQLEATGLTDIAEALDTAISHIEDNQQPSRTPMVILFSDGYSELDLDSVIEPYTGKNIVINTVGMSEIDRSGAQLLKQIAAGTGGSFHDVNNASELSKVFEKIYLENQDRLLVTERHGVFTDSTYLAVLRVILLTLVGGLFGLMLGMIFDNRYLAKSYVITGLLSGILAGLVLEIGQQGGVSPLTYRFIAAVLLTAFTGLGTMVIPIKEKYSGPVTATGRPAFSTRSYANKDNVKKSF